LAAALIAVGAGAFVLWRGEQHLARQEAEHPQRLAELAQEREAARAAAERAAGQVVEQQKSVEQGKALLAKGSEDLVRAQLLLVGAAYRRASEQLGRPPKGPEELTPFLGITNGLLSPRDRQPFEVAWGTPVPAPGRLLAWESTPWEDGGRMVLTTEVTAPPKRVTAEEFKNLSGKSD
jgi:hypothetical protein